MIIDGWMDSAMPQYNIFFLKTGPLEFVFYAKANTPPPPPLVSAVLNVLDTGLYLRVCYRKIIFLFLNGNI